MSSSDKTMSASASARRSTVIRFCTNCPRALDCMRAKMSRDSCNCRSNSSTDWPCKPCKALNVSCMACKLRTLSSICWTEAWRRPFSAVNWSTSEASLSLVTAKASTWVNLCCWKAAVGAMTSPNPLDNQTRGCRAA